MDQIATHLTPNFIQNLMESPNRKLEAILQVIKIKSSQEKKNSLQVVLSDGFFFLDFLLITQKAEEFSKVKELDVIECRVLYYNSRKLRVIFDFKQLYKDLNEKIGNPLPFSETDSKVNNSGSNQIPQKALRTTPSYQTQNKIKVQITDQNGQKKTLDAERINHNSDLIKKSDLIDKKFFTDIINLNVYEKGFRIRGSIQRISKMREFNKKDSEEKGHVFSCVINDGTRELQVTFFNDDAVKYYEVLQKGKNYSFVNGSLRPSSRFNSTSNKLEMMCARDTEITSLPETDLEKNYYSIVPLKQIKNLEAYKCVDILAIVTSVEDKRTITFKDGRESEIRNIDVRDSEAMISVSLWGEFASFDYKIDHIYLFQNLIVKDYKGKTLSTSEGFEIKTNIPDIEEYRKLLMSEKKGDNLKIESLTQNQTFNMNLFSVSYMIDNSEELISDPMNKRYYTVIANLTHVPLKLFYDSCLMAECKRKVIENSTGRYDCEKCDKQYDKPKHRFIGNLKFCDDSGSFYCLIAGADMCKLIFGMEEEELYDFQNINQDNNIFIDFVHSKLFRSYKLNITAKVEFYNGNSNVKYNCGALKSVKDSAQFYAKKLFELLN